MTNINFKNNYFKIKVTNKEAGIRLDKFLIKKIIHKNITRNKIQKLIKSGNILVNKKIIKSNYLVKELDNIKISNKIFYNDIIKIKAENIPLNIIYEDNDLLLINKSPGMVMYPATGHISGTLVNALKYRFNNLPTLDHQSNRPGIVHRIDKNTSGIIIVAKTLYSLTHLLKQFVNHTIKREYIAIVWGNIKNDTGIIIENIGRSLINRKKMAILKKSGKKAITHYKVLERLKYVTLISCKLETGRTHQIRVHLQHIGHPIFNDYDYGGNKILLGNNMYKYKSFIKKCFNLLPKHRQTLHAKSLGFIHPRNKKFLFFTTKMPNDMNIILNKWRIYHNTYL